MAWTTPQDIKNRWLSPKAPPTDDKLAIFIEDTEAQIIAAYPKIQERITEGKLKEALIRSTVARIIIEYVSTEGSPYAQEAQAYAGIGSRSVTIASHARRDLVLTAEDLAIFAPAKSAGFAAITMNYGQVPTAPYGITGLEIV